MGSQQENNGEFYIMGCFYIFFAIELLLVFAYTWSVGDFSFDSIVKTIIVTIIGGGLCATVLGGVAGVALYWIIDEYYYIDEISWGTFKKLSLCFLADVIFIGLIIGWLWLEIRRRK